MTTTNLKIGDRVVRLDGGLGYQGKKGVVIEMNDTRARVKWDDRTVRNPYDASRPPIIRSGKRTWVGFGSLRQSS